jgi:glycyl-tRNA synthetase (class II)
MGLWRIVLASLCDAYTIVEETGRTYLKFEPRVAPIKVWVLPVVKKIW